MNIKKIAAGAVASIMAVSTMAIAASAAAEITAVTFVDGTGKAILGDSSKGANTRITWESVADILPEGVNINDVYGVQLSFDGEYDPEKGLGGSFIFSTKGKNWNGVTWGNDGAGQDIVYDDANKTLTRMETEPFFTETDISGAEGEYAQIVVDAYWGSGELTVTKLAFLDKDGKELTAGEAPTTDAPATDAPATDATQAGTDAPSTTPDKNQPDTGIEGVAVVAGLAVLATGAIVIAKKRK